MVRFLRYDAVTGVPPVRFTVELNRCYHGKILGVYARRGTRCYSWLWRLCK